MQRLFLYARLMRLDKPVGIWLVFFPAAWAVGLAACHEVGLDWAVLFACLVGAGLTRSAGCIVNDLTDQTLDAGVARTASRPLASGAVTRREAYGLLVLFALLSLGLALLLPPLVLTLACVSVPFILAYPWMKRFTWWPQAFLGITFNLSAPIGWAAATGGLDWPALWLYLGAILWTFGYDTIYAHQDAADDARVGIRSSALALGDRTKPVVAACYALFLLCLLMAGIKADAGVAYSVAVLVLAGGHLCWQVQRLDIRDPALCGRLFRSNQWVGLFVALGACIAALA